MVGTTLMHHSSISYFQDQDIQGRLHSGRSHLTDDLGIISLASSMGKIALRHIIVEHCSIQLNVPNGIHH